LLAECQLLAISGLTFWILTFKGSAVGSRFLAHLRNQGSF
jgi:hypothetical protein